MLSHGIGLELVELWRHQVLSYAESHCIDGINRCAEFHRLLTLEQYATVCDVIKSVTGLYVSSCFTHKMFVLYLSFSQQFTWIRLSLIRPLFGINCSQLVFCE